MTARLRLLNGFSVEICGEERDVPVPAQRLLAYLALVGRPTRSALAGHLWPEVGERQALGSLRSTLWRLQRTAPGLVHLKPGSVRIAPEVEVDARSLREWAEAVLNGDGTPEPGSQEVLTSELLPGWYDDWVIAEREHLHQLRVQALEVLAERLTRAGAPARALTVAYAAVRSEPLRESAHRAVIRAHLAQGNTASAMEQYEECCRLLVTEIGAPPSRQLDELVLAFRTARPRRRHRTPATWGPRGRRSSPTRP